MTRQEIDRIAALGLAALSFSPASAAEGDRPNLILIMTDQQTAEAMSCAGNPYVNTPNMDALAAEGVRFTRAYCPYPLSGPSRTSIITGMIPSVAGVSDNAQTPSKEAMDRGLGHVFSEAGYRCMYAGKWHIPSVSIPKDGTGFEKLCNMDDRIVPDACDKALDSYHGEKPLMLVASFLDPHEICEFARYESLPYGNLPPSDPKDLPPLPTNFGKPTKSAEALEFERNAAPRIHDTYTWDENDWRGYLYAYYRLVERADRELGRLLDVLKKHGLYDSSVILFCSDHGDGAAAHQWNQKWCLYEESINVPLIVKAPGGLRGTVNTEALTNIGTDIYSTFCDYAGVRTDPERYIGRSLRPVIEGKRTKLHDKVFVETYLSSAQIHGWAIETPRYKYVMYQWGRNKEALYDLVNDPGEMVNLIDDPARREVVKKMHKDLLDWGNYIKNPKLLKNIRQMVEYDSKY